MELIQKVKKATCRVDHGRQQIGSSFWVNDNLLATAAHVVDAAPEDTVTIQTFEGERFTAKTVYRDPNTRDDPGSDLAIIETSDQPGDHEILSIDSVIPPISTEVLWAGYARLFGEPKIDRQRFGWGRIASEEYAESNGTFFEVDGLFNPSHSGGPVIQNSTGQVIGVVSATAGGFDRLEEAWNNRVHDIQTLFNISKTISGDSMSGILTPLHYNDPGEAIKDQSTIENVGLNTKLEQRQQGEGLTLTVQPNEIPMRVTELQADTSELLLDTARSTFQMGVGIASGGDALGNLLS